MQQIMQGELTPVQIAGVLVALRAKGETVDEIAAAAEVMRALSTKVIVADDKNLVDTCGTGGDSHHTFNISTTSAFVAAAAGAKVAKHGGRSVSSTCGSADVLESLGVNVNLTPEQVGRSIAEVGLGFMFAPNHHSAMKHAAPVRRELGVRTLFNLLGPMTNPAGAKKQLLGVFKPELVGMLARVLQSLGSHHVMVVHGADGMDEISLATETHVAELKAGKIFEYKLHPEEFGFTITESSALVVRSIAEAKELMLAVLSNQQGPARDIVALNAGAAIYVADITPDLKSGVDRAEQILNNGAGREKLSQLIAFSAQFSAAPT